MTPLVETYRSRDEWRAAHCGCIGGRGAVAILGLDPYKSPLRYYAELQGLIPEDDAGDGAKWGLRFEAPLRDWYEEETGRKIETYPPWTLLRHPDLPFVIGTPDGVVRRGDHEQDPKYPAFPARGGDAVPAGPGIYEGKLTGGYAAKNWEEEPPIAAQIQVAHYEAVTGLQWGSIAGLIFGYPVEGRWADVPRNERFIATLLREVEAFVRRLVDKNPPPADGGESTREALAHLYPRETVERVALPDEAIQWVEQRERGAALQKDGKALHLDATNRLIALVGDAAEAVLPDGRRLTYKTQKKAAYEVPEWTGRVLLGPWKGKG